MAIRNIMLSSYVVTDYGGNDQQLTFMRVSGQVKSRNGTKIAKKRINLELERVHLQNMDGLLMTLLRQY